LTAQGCARNRRVAITILSEELAAADTTPAAPTNALADYSAGASRSDVTGLGEVVLLLVNG
jgi:hypothetical protein